MAAELPPLVVANSASPGFIETDLVASFLSGSGKTAAEAGALPPERSTPVFQLLLFGDLKGARGWYFGSDAQRSPVHKYRSPGSEPYDGSSD